MPAEPAIRVEGLGKSFGEQRAIENLSFEVGRGEVFGLLGPNGAGKTTTLRILAGLYAPDTGRATVVGETVTPGAPGGPELRRRIGLLTEQPGFYDRLDARTNLTHFARLYGLAANEAHDRARVLLDRFALTEHARRPFSTLSRGMKQKLAIARALIHRPSVVLLDEPTVGLDPEATREVREIVHELVGDGVTVLLCTHQLDEVERLCDRAAFIAGRLIGIHQVADVAGSGRRVVVTLSAGPDDLTGRLESLEVVEAVRIEDDRLHIELVASDAVPELVTALVNAGAEVQAVMPARHALEEAYLELLTTARAEGLVE